MDAPGEDAKKKDMLRRLLDMGWERLLKSGKKADYACCINTELNSTNFLIGGEQGGNFLIDWEKPLYGEPAQDLGHFLAPTTTFWKTDVILGEEETAEFIRQYEKQVSGRFDTEGIRERTYTYIPITCLRGVTWCAMAWVEYQRPDRLLFNQSTFEKLKAYLSWDFLNYVEGVLKRA